MGRRSPPAYPPVRARYPATLSPAIERLVVALKREGWITAERLRELEATALKELEAEHRAQDKSR